MSDLPVPIDPGMTAEGLWAEPLESAWRAWRAGQEPPRWDDFLVTGGKLCPPEQVFFLMQIDVEFRARAGLPGLLAEPYFCHPRLAEAGSRLDASQQLELIRWEYQKRWRNGDRARRSEYHVAFPAHAAALHDLQPHWTCPSCRRLTVAEEDVAAASLFCPHCGTEVPSAEMFRARAALAQATADLEAETRAAPRGLGLVQPVVPGYEIREELGRGGMGIVYKALQLRLNRLVAIKMVLAGVHASVEELVRFLGETEVIARLQHPHIVQIFEVSQHQGRPYFTMEFVEGGSLAAKLGGTPWPASQAAALVQTLAGAVEFAHGRGIVHRDLKPANVLLTADGLPKIADFGLAKHLEVGVGLTQSGAILGTPSYMAPEQAGGKSQATGPATDVYALGAILYEVLTGRPPFQAATVVETLDQVRHQEPVPPSRLQPRLPRDLETICLKCLAKEPARRYAAAQALADDLHRFLHDQPILARPAGTPERLRRWCRRNPRVAGLLGALVLVVVAGLTGVTSLWLLAERHRRQAEAEGSVARRERDEADRQRARARSNYHKALTLIDGLLGRVADQRLDDPQAFEEERARFLAHALVYYREFLREEGADPAVRRATGRAFQWAGWIHSRQGKRARAEEAWKQSRDLLAKLAADFPGEPKYRNDLAGNHLMLAGAYQASGRISAAEAACAKSIAMRLQLVREHPDKGSYQNDLAGTYEALGLLYQGTGRPVKARESFDEAVAIRRRVVPRDPGVIRFVVGSALNHLNSGDSWTARGQLSNALENYVQAIRTLEIVLDAQPRNAEVRRFLERAKKARAATQARLEDKARTEAK